MHCCKRRRTKLNCAPPPPFRHSYIKKSLFYSFSVNCFEFFYQPYYTVLSWINEKYVPTGNFKVAAIFKSFTKSFFAWCLIVSSLWMYLYIDICRTKNREQWFWYSRACYSLCPLLYFERIAFLYKKKLFPTMTSWVTFWRMFLQNTKQRLTEYYILWIVPPRPLSGKGLTNMLQH